MALNREKIVASAQKFIQRGQLDKAIKEFQRIVEEDPKDVRTLLKIGDLFSKKGERDNAIQTYLKVAEFYSEQGFFLKAVAVFKQILKVDPSLIDVNVKLADLYGQLGLGSDALTQYQNVALYYEKAGDTARTLQILRKMIDLDPQNVGIRIKLAEMFAKTPETVAAAIGEFNEAAKVLKESNRLGDYAKVCERVLFLQPDNVALARELSELYLKQNDVKRALAKLQLCFKADPRDIGVLEMLAQAFLALGQTPKTVSVYRELAKIHAEKGDYEKRRTYLKQILELQPDDEEVRADLEMRAGTAKVQAPPPPPQEAVSAQSPASAGTAQPAAAAQKPAAQPAPAQAQAQLKPQEMIQKLLTETDVYVKYGLKDKALEHLKKIFSLAPNNLEAHAKVKDIYLQGGDTDGAVGILLKMANIAVEAGQADRARAWLQEAARQDPNNPHVSAQLAKLEPEEAEILEDDVVEEAAPPANDEGVELVVDDNAALEEEDLATPPLPPLDAADSDQAPEEDGVELEPPEPEAQTPPVPELEDEAPSVEEPAAELPTTDTSAEEEDGGLRVQSGEGRTDPRPRVQSGESSLNTGVDEEDVAPPMPQLEENDDIFDRGTAGEEEELTSPRVSASTLQGKPKVEIDDETQALVDDELTAKPSATLDDEETEADTPETSADAASESTPAHAPPEDDELEPPTDTEQLAEDDAAAASTTTDTGLDTDDRPANDVAAHSEAAESPALDDGGESAEAVDVSDELEEAEFFLQQELTDEAIEVYKNVLKKVPGHPEAVAALKKLGVDVPAAPAKKPPVAAKPAATVATKPVASVDNKTAPHKPLDAKSATPPAAKLEPKIDAKIETKPTTPPAKVETKPAATPLAKIETKPAAAKPTTPVVAKPDSAKPAAKPVAAVAKAAEATPAATDTKPKVAGVTKSLIDESSLGGDAFDLASELADDLAEAAESAPVSAPQEIQFSAEDVLSEFKKGVAATVSQEDFATHYDLGIAYKEMGLTEEAVREFEIASKAKEKEIEAWSMIGVCRLILGDAKGAIAAFKTASNSDRITAAQTVAVQYELANAYEAAGDHAQSKSLFEKVAKLDPKFRDASERAKSPAKTPPPEDSVNEEFDLASELAPAANDGQGGDQPKKGKISYV